MARRRAGRPDRDMDQIIAVAQAQGWRVKHTTKNHVVLLAPDGENSVILAPGVYGRNVKNRSAALRRLGLVLPDRLK